jgi:hypothetical protein
MSPALETHRVRHLYACFGKSTPGRSGCRLMREASRDITVPTIVPVGGKRGASAANSSQVAESEMLWKRKNLREKTKMAEKLIGV